MQAEQQNLNSSTDSHLQKKYPFLNNEEISAFIECHSWLNDEKDFSITEQYLEEYFQGLAVRYKTIVDSIEGMKTGKTSNEEKKEDGKAQDQTNKQNSNLGNFEMFLDRLQSLHQDLFELKNQRTQFHNIIQFLNTVLNMLSKNVKDPNIKQIGLLDAQFKEDKLLIILNVLGYEIVVHNEKEIVVVLQSEPSQEFISLLIDTLSSLYLRNPQFLRDIQNDPSQRPKQEPNKPPHQEAQKPQQPKEFDRASFLAAKHEQRLGQSNYNPSSVNRVSNDPSLANLPNPPIVSYSNNPNASQNQNKQISPEDIRKKIYNTNAYFADSTAKNIIEEHRKQVTGMYTDDKIANDKNKNMMTLTDLKNREIFEDAIPKLPEQSNSKVITGQDIERMRIEEDKVKLGLRALELTNKFRASQNLPPLTWSQELCDVGMEHSRDMALQRVPFGHFGFDKRCKKVKFSHQSMAENVAYNSGYEDPAKAAVDGWITSPGHRKNLLSQSNICAISCYRATNGSWYFTQLFALRV